MATAEEKAQKHREAIAHIEARRNAAALRKQAKTGIITKPPIELPSTPNGEILFMNAKVIWNVKNKVLSFDFNALELSNDKMPQDVEFIKKFIELIKSDLHDVFIKHPHPLKLKQDLICFNGTLNDPVYDEKTGDLFGRLSISYWSGQSIEIHFNMGMSQLSAPYEMKNGFYKKKQNNF